MRDLSFCGLCAACAQSGLPSGRVHCYRSSTLACPYCGARSGRVAGGAMPSPRRGKSHDRMRTHALAAPTTLSPREYGPGRWLRPWLRSCPGSFLVGDGVSNARPTSLHTGGAEVDSQDGDHVDGIHCDPVVQYVVWNMYNNNLSLEKRAALSTRSALTFFVR